MTNDRYEATFGNVYVYRAKVSLPLSDTSG